MSVIDAIIIAIIEGLTEFLPVSSTGHMIITEALIGNKSTELTKLFIINIQFGAILSVVALYWRQFFLSRQFYLKLLIAFIPAAIIGFLFERLINALLENVIVVAISLLLGGIILIFVDSWFSSKTNNQTINYKSAFVIGIFQCAAMVPGVSRSAATIIGGMSQGLSRKQAAEFSFFLAVPTMCAASAYKLLKTYTIIHAGDIKVILIGNIVAFIVAFVSIKSFIAYITNHGFRFFGYYRIALGMLILTLAACGYDISVK